jgi:HPt (histidine-containing phosphotransfer) domain-containing protein
MSVNADDRLTDPTVLLQAAGDNKDAFCDLLRLFLSIFPSMVDRLEHFYAAADVPKVAQQAHGVKGCLYLVGAMRSAEKVEAIEMVARRDKALYPSAEFEQLMGEMRCVIEEVNSDLNPATRLSAEEIR